LALIGALAARSATAQTFPADNSPDWAPLEVGGVSVKDSDSDLAVAGGRNVVGAGNVYAPAQPSVLVASDATYLYFRLRIAEEPTANNSTWGCEIDVD
jgi:hypothetical protein